VGADGRALFIMPSAEYAYLSDQDVADLLAFIRTVPAVDRDLPARKFGPVGRTLAVTGKIPFQPDLIAGDASERHMNKPTADNPVELGYYLTRLCTGCHGPDLAGAAPMDPASPPGANLTQAGNLKNWSLDQFREVFRTGRTPEGRQLDPQVMPWQLLGVAHEQELEAIWAYLQTLEAKAGPPAKQ
jgi:cytochrome c553